MNLPFACLALAAAKLCSASSAQTGEMLENTTICAIVDNPQQYIGKMVKIRAQVWPPQDDQSVTTQEPYWMNESAAAAGIGKACRFLPARFQAPLYIGVSGFGTFTGRIISNPAHKWSHAKQGQDQLSQVLFIVEHQSDVRAGAEDTRSLRPANIYLFDQQSGSLITARWPFSRQPAL